MYFTYVIRSETSGKIYVGQTDNLEERLEWHNGKKLAKRGSYTKLNKGPWKVVYKEEFKTRKEAIERETFLKSHQGRDWLRNGPIAQR